MAIFRTKLLSTDDHSVNETTLYEHGLHEATHYDHDLHDDVVEFSPQHFMDADVWQLECMTKNGHYSLAAVMNCENGKNFLGLHYHPILCIRCFLIYGEILVIVLICM